MFAKNKELEKVIETFPIAMLEINKEIDSIIKSSSLGNLLSREQVEAMRIIRNLGSITINGLAEQQNIFKSAASKRVNKLENLGYVTQLKSKDKRVKIVALTDKGDDFLSLATKTMAQLIENRLSSDLSDKEIKDLIEKINFISRVFLKK